MARKSPSNPLKNRLPAQRVADENDVLVAQPTAEETEAAFAELGGDQEPDPRPEGYEPPQYAAQNNPEREGQTATADEAKDTARAYFDHAVESGDLEAEVRKDPEAVPSNVIEKLRAMEAEMAALRAEQKAAAERASDTDDRFFVMVPNGARWSERKIVDRQYAEVEYSMSKFLGPFDTREMAEEYLAVKRRRDSGSWANVSIVDGEERRAIRRREIAQAEDSGAREIPV